MASGARLGRAALGFGLAALFASWNPVAAPFGLLVGLPAALLAARALRRGERRVPALLGLAAAVAALLVSGAVLAFTAGVGREGAGAALVPAPEPAETKAALDAAAAASARERQRARDELDRLQKAPPAN